MRIVVRYCHVLWTHVLPLEVLLVIPGLVHRVDEHVADRHHVDPFALVLARLTVRVREFGRSL